MRKSHNDNLAGLHNIYGMVLGLLKIYSSKFFRGVIMQFAHVIILISIPYKFYLKTYTFRNFSLTVLVRLYCTELLFCVYDGIKTTFFRR